MNLPKPLAFSYIRFSNPEQAKGDSLRRQTDAARAWAKVKGLELDETLKMTDQGVSAFKGGNKEEALGAFLTLVQAGKIPAGSYLIVESLDRISREEVLSALATFTSIINAGITIVTLGDQREYTKATINANPMELMVSILVMQRAHEESLTKSKRVGAAWKQKRDNAHLKKMTRQVPSWIVVDAAGEFSLHPKNAKIVQEIFRLYISGMGLGLIQRTLNDPSKGMPYWGDNAEAWHSSYIREIIHNRKALGELQPKKLVGKKRIPDGPAIPNYYPAVVDEATYYQAMNIAKIRRKQPGRAGVQITNIFVHRSFCGYCGSQMVASTKGTRGTYLTCAKIKLKSKCVKASIRLGCLEKAFLRVVTEVNIAELSQSPTVISQIDAEIAAASGKIAVNEQKLANIIKTIEEGASPKLMAKRMGELEKEIESDSKQVEELKNKRAAETPEDSAKDIRDMVSAMANLTPVEKAEFRIKLRSKIQNTVRKMTIWGAGKLDAPSATEFQELGYDDARIAAYLQERTTPNIQKKWIEVEFPDGVVAFGWKLWGRLRGTVGVVVRTKMRELRQDVVIH